MLTSARSNDAFCSGLLYVVLHFHSSFHPASGWCMDMKSMKTPKSAVWIVASGWSSPFFSNEVGFFFQLPPRALAHPPHEHRAELRELRALGVGVVRRTHA